MVHSCSLIHYFGLELDNDFYPGWQMGEMEKTQRLQEIQLKLDPRAQARVRDGGVFKPGELLRRRLVHEGTLFWKTQGSRLKGKKKTENFSL